MDLASGYSDSINYGNGYTPLATGAINNNNADYLRNQMAMAMMAQAYNPYANSGGSFGAMPAYYAGQGAAYGRATGGFNAMPASPSGDVQRGDDLPNISPTSDPFGGMSGADMTTWSRAMQAAGRGGEIPTTFADRYSAAPAIQPGLQPMPNDLPRELQWGINPSPSQPQLQPSMQPPTGSSFNSRFTFPPSTPDVPELTPQDFPGWTPPQPAQSWVNAS